MIDYYLKNLHLYAGTRYGICLDFDIENKFYLKISCANGLEIIDTKKYGTCYVNYIIDGVDII